eukprot:gene9467-10281_t
MPQVKLDLMNTRIEQPGSTRVFDSLEDRPTRSDGSVRSQKSLVKMAPTNTRIKANSRRELSKMLPSRFEYLKYDRKGRIIDIQERLVKALADNSSSTSLTYDTLPSLSQSSSSPNNKLTSLSMTRDISSPSSSHAQSPLSLSRSLLSRDGLLQEALSGQKPNSLTKKDTSEAEKQQSEDETETAEDTSHLDEEARRKYLRRRKYERQQAEKERQKEKEREENYHPTLDKLRDKLYEDTSYTIANRIKTKKLPGASWSDVSREVKDRNLNPNTGPGYYNIYRPATSSNALKFDNIPREKVDNVFATSDRIINSIEKIDFDKDLQYFPLQEKQRITRQINEMQQKYPKLIKLKTEKFKDYIPPTDCAILQPHVPTITLSSEPRFDSLFYRQEPFIKTTGLTLSNDYDKKLDKKLSFRFNKSESRLDGMLSNTTSETKDVHVDVTKHYEMKSLVMKSSLNYAASFRSSAKVGLDIPLPTTAPHVGPGTFNHHKPAVAVKDPDRLSVAFLSPKPPLPRQSSPDTFMRVPSFAELHTKGPFFSEVVKESSMGEGDSRNRHLQNIVVEKMTQIYPKLAEKKFASSRRLELERGQSSSRIGTATSTLSRAGTSRSLMSRGGTSRSPLRMSSPSFSPLSRSVSSKRGGFADSHELSTTSQSVEP